MLVLVCSCTSEEVFILLSAEMANNVQLMTIIYSCYDHIKKAKIQFLFTFINGDYEQYSELSLHLVLPHNSCIIFTIFPQNTITQSFTCILPLHSKTKRAKSFLLCKI